MRDPESHVPRPASQNGAVLETSTSLSAKSSKYLQSIPLDSEQSFQKFRCACLTMAFCCKSLQFILIISYHILSYSGRTAEATNKSKRFGARNNSSPPFSSASKLIMILGPTHNSCWAHVERWHHSLVLSLHQCFFMFFCDFLQAVSKTTTLAAWLSQKIHGNIFRKHLNLKTDRTQTAAGPALCSPYNHGLRPTHFSSVLWFKYRIVQV